MKVIPLCIFGSLLVAFSGTLVSQAAAQPPASEAAPTAAREPHVYKLKNSTASEIANVLSQVFSSRGGARNFGAGMEEARFAVDSRTNSVVVLGGTNDLAAIEKVIKAMDAEPSESAAPRRQLKLIHLAHAKANDALRRELEVVFRHQPASFSIDEERRVVVVSGDVETIRNAEQVIHELDAATAQKSTGAELQVRVVWLASGPGLEKAAKAPADLNDVIAELAKLGIDKPWLAAQGMVNAMPDAQFQLDGTAKLDTSCEFAVVGRITDGRESPVLQIEIKAVKHLAATSDRAAPGGQVTQLCNLNTRISTPLGHAVVLGVTPTDGLTSVFVVQVMPKEAAKQPKR